MVVALILLLALSVATRDAPLFLLSLALLVAALTARLWERYALERVEYRRVFERPRASFGECVDLRVEVVNRKPLPLSWLEIEDEMSAGLELAHGRVESSHKPGRALLSSLMAMRPYERVRRRYTLRCAARGEHAFGPVRLRSGDLFGFALCDRTLEVEDSLIVYPRVVPLESLGLPARNPLGDVRAHSWIFEDPSRVAGARMYRPGDSLRRIHWPATARSGRLQTRVFEATTGHKLGVFLNVAADELPYPGFGVDSDLLEFSIVVAASVAAWGLEQGFQVGLYANGLHRGGRSGVVVRPGRNPEQLEQVLLALARLLDAPGERFESLLSREARGLPFGTTAVVVSPSISPEAEAGLRLLRRGGHGVVVLQTGRYPAGAADLSVRRVGPPESWRETAAIRA